MAWWTPIGPLTFFQYIIIFAECAGRVQVFKFSSDSLSHQKPFIHPVPMWNINRGMFHCSLLITQDTVLSVVGILPPSLPGVKPNHRVKLCSCRYPLKPSSWTADYILGLSMEECDHSRLLQISTQLLPPNHGRARHNSTGPLEKQNAPDTASSSWKSFIPSSIGSSTAQHLNPQQRHHWDHTSNSLRLNSTRLSPYLLPLVVQLSSRSRLLLQRHLYCCPMSSSEARR